LGAIHHFRHTQCQRLAGDGFTAVGELGLGLADGHGQLIRGGRRILQALNLLQEGLLDGLRIYTLPNGSPQREQVRIVARVIVAIHGQSELRLDQCAVEARAARLSGAERVDRPTARKERAGHHQWHKVRVRCRGGMEPDVDHGCCSGQMQVDAAFALLLRLGWDALLCRLSGRQPTEGPLHSLHRP